MKTRFWSRLLIAFCGLMTLAFGVALFAYGAGFFPFHLDLSALDYAYAPWQRAVIVAVSLLMAFVGVYAVSVLFRRGKDKGFIIQHTEFGDMSISMRALENMVKKCVESHEELLPGSIRIIHARDGVVVSIKVTLNGNANIPLTVNALQKQIKQYITSSSGVDVKEVRVMVETNASKLDAPPPVEEAPAPEPSRADSIFHHTEEPSRYAWNEPKRPPEPSEPAPEAEQAPSADEPPAEQDIPAQEAPEASDADSEPEAQA